MNRHQLTSTISSVLFVLLLLLAINCETHNPPQRIRKRTVGVLTLKPTRIAKLITRQYKFRILGRHSNTRYLLANSSYISEGYIRWLDSVGIKTVPIDINADKETLLREVEKVDGLLLTGGSQSFYLKTKEISVNAKAGGSNKKFRSQLIQRIPGDYLDKIDLIMRKAKEINDEKRKFPVWATCLAFEAMLVSESHYTLYRHEVENEIHAPLPIEIINPMSRAIRFFSRPEKEMFDLKKLFYFNHKWGVYLDEILKNEYLKNEIVPIATINKNDHQVLVWFEYKDYPFVGSQFHPEKFVTKPNLPGDTEIHLQKDINHKIAMFFKSMLELNTNYISDVPEDEEFDSEVNDAHFDLYDVGMYEHINFYIRPLDKTH